MRSRTDALINTRQTAGMVTAQDVAVIAGVSRSAVSRAFTPGAPVAAETRSRIKTIAAELGYTPNVLARSLITGRSNLVAMVVNSIGDLWDTFFLDRLFQAIQAMGKQPLIVHTHAAPDLRQVLQDGASYQIDGVLVFADNVTPAMTKQVFRSGAVVMLNRLERPEDDVDAVRIDERAELTRTVDLLVAAGHRRIAYVSGRLTASFEDGRRESVISALQRHGMELWGGQRGGDFSYEAGATAATELLGAPEKPDAILCACDAMAFGVMDVARTTFGLRVPNDVSIIGFDDIPIAAWPAYDLTTIRQDPADIGIAAIELLMRRLGEPGRPAETRVLPTTLVRRGSARLA